LRADVKEPDPPEKRAVRRAFERAAASYDGAAVLHREIGARLLQHLIRKAGRGDLRHAPLRHHRPARLQPSSPHAVENPHGAFRATDGADQLRDAHVHPLGEVDFRRLAE